MKLEKKLTKSIVDAIQPTDKETFYWDTELKGFGLRVQTSGAKGYLVQYRTPGGQTKRQSLGRHGTVTADEAREKARQLLAQVQLGGDPSQERHDKRNAITLKELAESYLKEQPLRDKTKYDTRKTLERVIYPKFGNRPAREIHTAELARLHSSMSDTPAAANRTLAYLSAIFGFGVKRKLITENPTQGITKYREQPRERYLSDEEQVALWEAMNAYDDQDAMNLIRLALLTGARSGEIRTSTWDQFDLKEMVWTKPSAHTKQNRTHRVPLNAPAAQLLQMMWENKKDADSPYVFPGKPSKDPEAPKKPRHDIKRPWAYLVEKAELGDCRVHDLRHTFASNLVSSGVSLAIIGGTLGHTQPKTTARYAHLADDPLRRAVEAAAAKFMPQGDKAGVTEISRKRTGTK